MKNLFYLCLAFIILGPAYSFAQKNQEPQRLLEKEKKDQNRTQLSLKGEVVAFTTEELGNTFKNYDLFQIDFSEVKEKAKKHNQFELTLKMGNKHQWNLLLMLNDMRGPGYKELIQTDNGLVEMPRRRAITYKGFINNPGSLGEEIRLNISDDFINGYVTINGQEYFIEPLGITDKKAPKDYYVIYRPQDVKDDGEHECTFDLIQKNHSYDTEKGKLDLKEENMAMACMEVDFATACTWDFVQLQGSDPVMANARIAAITNLVEGLYAPFMLDYVIVGQFAPASAVADPFIASDDAFPILADFRTWAGPNLPTHDLGQIWVGRDIQGCGGGPGNFGLIGCAECIGCVCGTNRYNVCENWNGNTNCLRTLSAHECGHNWDGVHSQSAAGSIMTPTINCSATTFTAGNTARIQAHIDSRNCLADCSCMLVVDCSNITDQTLSCRADLPPVDFNLPIITESCGNATLSALTIIPGNTGCPGDEITITRTYFIQDGQGNMDQCMQTFTIVSNVLPTIQCPAGAFISCEDELPNPPMASDATATSECGTPSVSITGPVVAGVPNCTSTTYTYTYTATDDCGRTASCDQIFTISSSFLSISCPPGGDIECVTDIPPISPSDATATANCDIIPVVTVSGPVIVGAPHCNGTTYTYTYQATSPCFPGLFVSCTRVFTIAGNDAPTFAEAPGALDEVINITTEDVCPNNAGGTCYFSTSPVTPISVDITFGGVFFANYPGPTAMDDCGLTIVDCGFVNVSFSECQTLFTARWRAEDSCGLETTYDQAFEINDRQSPTIVCPADMTVECAVDIVVDPNNAMADDNCSVTVTATGPVLVFGQADCPGARYEVTYTATDPCGNPPAVCIQTLTIRNDPPVIVCPAGFTVMCAADIVVDPSDATVTTSCMLGFNVAITGPKIQNGLADCPGTTYTYFYVVEDDCGRQAQCDRTFTIDNVGPTVTCLAQETVECVDDISPDFSTLVTTVSCGSKLKFAVEGPNLVSGQENCPNAIYELIYTVTDPCSRSASCTHSFIIDNPAPMITECAPDRVVLCSSDIEAETESIGFTVSCGLGYTLTASATVALDGLGDCPGAQYEITYTLEDACGRQDFCTQTFTVQNDAPRVYPDEDQHVSCREDINPRWELCFVETDCNLGIVRYEIIGPIEDVDAPDCDGKIINYLYSVWDGCGRMTCVAQAWIIENDGPTFDNAPADVTVACTEVPDGLDVTASFSGCGNIKVDIADVIVPLLGLDYEIKRTFTAMDDCGQSRSIEQTITVLCNGPSHHEEVCNLTQESWGDEFAKDQQGRPVIDWLKMFDLHNDELTIGIPGRAIIVKDLECVLRMLPAEGAPGVFPADIGDLLFSDGTCERKEIKTDEKGQLWNTLAGQTIALKLNFRKTPGFDQVYLADICVNFSEVVINVLPENPRVRDASNLADATLGGQSEVLPIDVETMIKAINEYFEVCRVPGNCNNGSFDGGFSQSIKSGKTSGFEVGVTALSLSPNPATDQVRLTYQAGAKASVSIQVFSTSGKLMYQNSQDELTVISEESLDISTWPPGMYMVILRNGEELLTEKLIKM